MSIQETIREYHKKLHQLWKNNHESDIPGFSRVPYLGQLPKENLEIEILFLGMNPSYIVKTLEEHWKAVQTRNQVFFGSGLEALQWDPKRSDKDWDKLREALAALDHYSRENYSTYYTPLKNIAIEVGKGSTWHHLDVFPIREKEQEDLVKHLKIPADFRQSDMMKNRKTRSQKWPQVMEQLLDEAIKLIIAMKPKVVLVANSHLSKVLEHRLPLTRQANGHRYETQRVPGVPFLLSSQISGGATSIYSRERLVADLQDVLDGKNGLNA